MYNLVQEIICSEFSRTFGRDRVLPTGVTQRYFSDPEHAMLVKFSLNTDFDVEEGYRHLSILIYGGGSNYISVFAKTDWNVISLDDLTDEDDARIKPGKDYTKGETPWVVYGNHDSGWRESVGTILSEFRDSILTIDTLFNGQTGWFQSVTVTETAAESFREMVNERYQGTSKKWEKASELGFRFPNASLIA